MLIWLLIQNIVPEAIAIVTISPILKVEFAHSCWLFLVYSVAIRLIWQSAIIIHGLGHTTAIALADKDLSVFNST
ncbi:MAG: hypothetical protein RLZZ04_235 [Cyanobacteriota bacterium]|jgi:hypothetical protein